MFFGGILGSSFVTLLIYATEYRIQKRITLESIWSEAHRINRDFKAIRYLHIDYPKEIVAGYLNEVVWDSQESSLIDTNPKHIYRSQWIDELQKQYPEVVSNKMSDDEFENILINIINNQANDYLKAINHSINSYITIVEKDWNEYDKLFGVVEFFTGKRHYKRLYQNLYAPLYQKRCSISEQVYPHFLLYRNGEIKNSGVMLTKLIELQSQFFAVETDKMGTHIYNDFWTMMERKIEDFRISIYKKETPDYPKRLHVWTTFSCIVNVEF